MLKRKATALDRLKAKRARSTSMRRSLLVRFIPDGKIVPDKLVTTVKYHDTFLSSSIGAYDFLFNMNSIFDPNRTGAGHQPIGHDQLATLYGRYRVTKCAWDISLFGTTAATIVAFAVVPSNSATSFASDAPAAFEQPYAQTRALGGMATVAGTWGQAQKVKGSIELHKIYGCTKSHMDGPDRYQAAFGASPTELAILHVFGAEYAAQNMQFVADVNLTFTVECFDRIQLGSS